MNASGRSCEGGLPSDTNILVEACLAEVRASARLDEDVVLPPLPQLAPRRTVALFTSAEVAAGLALLAPPARDEGPVGAVWSPRLAKPRRRRGRWPVVLCGFVASAFASAAFFASPLGHRPSVTAATRLVGAHARTAASHAVDATRSAARVLHAG
jgi:hypothetical protein